MKRFVSVLMAALCAVFLCSCMTSGGLRGTRPSMDSEFAAALKMDFGDSVAISNGTVTLQDDLQLGWDKSIVLDTGEVWEIDFNGWTIRSLGYEGEAAIKILSGGIVFSGSSDDDDYGYQGGVLSEDGLCLLVGSQGAVQIKSGEFCSWGDYCIKVESGGILKVSGGSIEGEELPILAEDGWQGSFSGGWFSGYDPAYEDAVAGGLYISVRFPESAEDFAYEWPDGFCIAMKGSYSGNSQLTLEAPADRNACFRLYRTYKADAYVKRDLRPDYQWMLGPGQKRDVLFTAGNYVLKVAEGSVWSDENAFGRSGHYWYMDPYEFYDNQAYIIQSTTQGGMSNGDDMDGFLNGI